MVKTKKQNFYYKKLFKFSKSKPVLLTQFLLSTGYLIPKGWKVLPLFRNIHHSPEIFPHPEKFDPSRFEVKKQTNKHHYLFTVTYFPHLAKHKIILMENVGTFFGATNLVKPQTQWLFWYDWNRLLKSPIPTCHLAMGPTPAQEMNWPSWRCWFYSII